MIILKVKVNGVNVGGGSTGGFDDKFSPGRIDDRVEMLDGILVSDRLKSAGVHLSGKLFEDLEKIRGLHFTIEHYYLESDFVISSLGGYVMQESQIDGGGDRFIIQSATFRRVG